MGFSTLIDIVGSTVVGGFLLLILLRVNESSVQNMYVNTGDLIVQQNLLEIVKVLEYDFKKIGYCKNWEKIPDPSKAIISAGPHSVKFITDLADPPTYPGGDGIVDTLYYYVGTTTAMSATPNPRDMKLYRVTNSETPKGSNLGVTQFDIKYFTALGDSLAFPITVPSSIYTMQISITVESTQAYAEKYSTVFWRQIRIAARNLRNR
jgi:hypothetical protein